MSDAEVIKKYRGNCHCGAFVFEVELPEIKTVADCNCSICYKRGALWTMPKQPPTIVKGDDNTLVKYMFGAKTATHEFCGNCGTPVLAAMIASGENGKSMVINNLDIWSLNRKPLDGAKLDPQYVPSVYSGPEPKPASFEGGKLYHGSCHCGAVTLAVKLKDPLEDGVYKEEIMDCNCSFCRRSGAIWIYPTHDQLAIHGSENLSHYVWGNKVWRRTFCRNCGTYVFTEPNLLTEEEVAALPERARTMRARTLDRRPLNIRVLDGFDVKAVTPIQGDCWALLQPGYVNP